MENNAEDKEAKARLEAAANDAEKKIDELLDYWESRRILLQALINHTVVESVEERLP